MSRTSDKVAKSHKESVEKPRIPSLMLLSAGVGAVLAAIFYVLVVHLLCRGTYVERIFSERGPIPYMTLYLAFVALTQLCGMFLHIHREERNLRSIAGVLGSWLGIDSDSAASIAEQINARIKLSDRKGLVVSRVSRVLRRVQNKGSAADVAALMSEQAEIDRAILSNSYASVRFIAWLIPILGFIGTVLGISLAIAGFPELFRSGSDTLGDQLGPITTNLGVAFDTTLLALIKVAVVMFVLFTIQKRGNELLNTFDEFCLDRLLGEVRGGGVPKEAEIPEPYRDLVRVLSGHVERMEEKFEQAVGTVVAAIVEQEQQRWQSFTDTFREAAREHQNTVSTICTALGDKTDALSSQMREFNPDLRAGIQEMVERLREIESARVQEIAGVLAEAGTQASSAMRQAGQDNAQSLSQVTGEFLRGLSGLTQVVHTGEELQAMQQNLNANLQALTQTGEMRDAVERVNETLGQLAPILRELQKRRRMRVRIVEESEGDTDGAAWPGSIQREDPRTGRKG